MRTALLRGHTYCPILTPSSIVVDAGAHRGEFSVTLARTVGARCWAIEANPDLIANAAQHTNVTYVQAALAGRDGTLTLRRAANPEGSTVADKLDGEQIDAIEVRAVSLASLMAEHAIDKIDLLKVDIEGAEIEVFDGCEDSLLAAIGQITVEFHDFNQVVAARDVERILTRMRGLGFSTLRMPRRFHGDVLMVNRALTGFTPLDALWQRHVVRRYRGASRILARARAR